MGDVEEGTTVGLEGPAHAGERAATGAARQAEQHGLGLVVSGVTEQDDVGVEAFADLLQDGVPGGAGGRLGPKTGCLHAGAGAHAVSATPIVTSCVTTSLGARVRTPP